MRGIRIVLKGLHDTLENLLSFTLVSMVWWLGLVFIVTGPAATIALFAQTDPRIGTHRDRRTWGEEFAFVRRRFARAWIVTLITAPLIAVLIINIVTMRPGESDFGFLSPVWLFLLLIVSFVTAGAFANIALLDLPAIEALKRSAILSAAHMPRALIVAFLLWIVVVIGSALIVPLFTFLPATVAATVNRFVLDVHKIEVIDPLTPTEERRREEAARRGARFGP